MRGSRPQRPLSKIVAALALVTALFAAGAASGGTLIVSGISSPRAGDVEEALNGAGFVTVLHREEDGEQRGDYTERWAAFVMTRAG